MDDEKLAGAPAEAPAGAQPEGTPPPVSGMDGQQALLDIQQIQSGQMPEINGTPSPEYAQALVAFYNSGEFEAMPPEQQQMFVQHIKAIKAAIGGEQPAPAPAPEAVQQPVQPIPVPEQPQGVPVQ
jgi:hypothetical protein